MKGQDDDRGLRFDGFESIPLRINVKVGGARKSLAELCRLEEGDVIELDRRIGEPFELLAHGYLLGLVEPVATPASPRRGTGSDGVAVKLIEVPEDSDVPGS